MAEISVNKQLLGLKDVHVVAGGPHGINVSHADEFNSALLNFLEK